MESFESDLVNVLTVCVLVLCISRMYFCVSNTENISQGLNSCLY